MNATIPPKTVKTLTNAGLGTGGAGVVALVIYLLTQIGNVQAEQQKDRAELEHLKSKTAEICEAQRSYNAGLSRVHDRISNIDKNVAVLAEKISAISDNTRHRR